MNSRGLLNRAKGMRLLVVLLTLVLAYGAISYSPSASTQGGISFELGGVTGTTNNTSLAFGRFVLVAPFWPSKGVASNGDLDVSQLDNHFLYVIDAKRSASPIPKDLTPLASKADDGGSIYFPSKVVFDSDSSNVYLRGTRFIQQDGDVVPVDVIAYVHLTLDSSGKPQFDNPLAFNIPGIGGSKYTNEAPLDFALSAKGNLVVFTNGASVFTYALSDGILSRVDIVPSGDYSADNNVSFLDVDQSTNVVSVCHNKNSVDKNGIATVSSEISFYQLQETGDHAGKLSPLKQVFANQFPSGVGLAGGSNIVIVSDADSEVAFFVTTDGSLCCVDLQGDGQQGIVKRLYSFPELAQFGAKTLNPALIQYDSSSGTVGVVNPGFTVLISRPINGKKGRISRPINVHVTSQTPVLAMAKFNKKGKVVSATSFAQDFKDEGGLSNFVTAGNSQWLVSTYSGKLYWVGLAEDLKGSRLQLLGNIAPRVDRLDYYSDRTSVVAISAFTVNDDGMQIASPGSLVVGKLTGGQIEAPIQSFLPTAQLFGARSSPSIRRPCNIKR
ncbi:MAG TPA: hypothetical protein VGL29_01405 [Blastocatellia bacterium]|jgi:hypothetical protein